ncbi:ACT domain-containing protein (plasmid) [Aliisedimentitalea scapharcae]|uniref:ACT domain-containing protein n=1 Tax=Aliisedimentitalea scapharcae TaxID=1524259 RepID=A0ABZ2XYX6_9RHOB
MGGETNLDVLVGSMSARLDKGLYVFATVPDRGVPDGVRPRMIFHEAEGVTLILLQEEAEAAGLAWEFPSRMITLGVHSSLEAVGFLARITTALAGQGMGVNPVSGFYHDHLFVPDGRELDAMAVLAEVAKRSA